MALDPDYTSNVVIFIEKAFQTNLCCEKNFTSVEGMTHSSLFPVWFIGKDEDLWRGTAFIWPPLHLLSELKIDVTLRIRVANLFLA